MSLLTSTSKSADKLLNSGVFTRADAEALSAKLNEPDWLRQKRQTAWTVFEETPLPTTSDEAWRRTDIRKVKWGKFKIADATSIAPAQELADLPAVVRDATEENYAAAGRIVIVNGQVVYHQLDAALAEQGVIFTDLSTAVAEHPELVEKYLGTEAVPPSNSKFAALNSALWQGGEYL